MTLQEALAELEAALDRRQVVNISLPAMLVLRKHIGRDILKIKWMASFIEATDETRYVMKTGDAEELRDMARRVLVEQVTEKLGR